MFLALSCRFVKMQECSSKKRSKCFLTISLNLVPLPKYRESVYNLPFSGSRQKYMTNGGNGREISIREYIIT